jgi:hypothetical protein
MVSARDVGRQPITIIEIDQDFCANTYGVSPCTAELGVTGTRKCFNTRATCQDTDNFDRDAITLRFCTAHDNLPRDINMFPTIMSVDSLPTEVNIAATDRSAAALGRRASITIELRDHPYHDRLIDPYWEDRGYDPMGRGTFWSKWLVRNPFHVDRPLRVRDGYVGQALEDMQVRNYVIDRIDGPANGKVRLIGKDPLRLLNSDSAVAPRPNSSRILSGTGGSPSGAGKVAVNATSMTLTPTGIGNTEFEASGYARVDDEIFSFTRSSDVLTFTGRGLFNSIAVEFSYGDTVQAAFYRNAARIEDIIYDLISEFSDVATSLIDYSSWVAEGDKLPYRFGGTAISEPTPVSTLIGELLALGVCLLWWDEREQKIVFRVIEPLDDADLAATVDYRANMIANTFSLTPRPEDRASRIYLYHTLAKPTEFGDKQANFLRVSRSIDADAELPEEYGNARIREIFTRWAHGYAVSHGDLLCDRLLSMVRDQPNQIAFELDAKDEHLTVGDVVEVVHPSIVDFIGDPLPTRAMIISYQPKKPGHSIAYKCRGIGAVPLISVTADMDTVTADSTLFTVDRN